MADEPGSRIESRLPSISADLSEDRRELIVHYLDESDPGAMVAAIKERYERPIMEVFG